MGNRSYLSIRTNGEEILLFEASNSLPFFWIGLLDKSILAAYELAWREYEAVFTSGDENEIERYTDIAPHPTLLLVDKTEFDANAARMEKFLAKHFPKSFPLFSDFWIYLQSVFVQEDSYLVLDILQIANFTSVGEFLESLYQEIQAIATDKPASVQYLIEYDLITSGTGFSVQAFDVFSVRYKDAVKSRDHPPTSIPSTVQRFSAKSLVLFVVVLLICPLFSYLTYRGYSKEGISVFVITLGLCNTGFYIFSIVEIYTQMQAYFHKHT